MLEQYRPSGKFSPVAILCAVPVLAILYAASVALVVSFWVVHWGVFELLQFPLLGVAVAAALHVVRKAGRVRSRPFVAVFVVAGFCVALFAALQATLAWVFSHADEIESIQLEENERVLTGSFWENMTALSPTQFIDWLKLVAASKPPDAAGEPLGVALFLGLMAVLAVFCVGGMLFGVRLWMKADRPVYIEAADCWAKPFALNPLLVTEPMIDSFMRGNFGAFAEAESIPNPNQPGLFVHFIVHADPEEQSGVYFLTARMLRSATSHLHGQSRQKLKAFAKLADRVAITRAQLNQIRAVAGVYRPARQSQ